MTNDDGDESEWEDKHGNVVESTTEEDETDG